MFPQGDGVEEFQSERTRMRYEPGAVPTGMVNELVTDVT